MTTIYDPIIRKAVQDHFPELDAHVAAHGWLWIKAQIWQESRFDPMAVSEKDAKGLMQLMPGTAAELGVTKPFSPVQSINAGVRYLADQYRHLAEITPYGSRLRFALASYNGGRGYVNHALALARFDEGLPFGYGAWRQAGSPAGCWQVWNNSARFLSHPACRVRGKRPDYRQITDYVHRIEVRALGYLKAVMSNEK